MTIKEKLLNALDFEFYDLSENCLLDLFLDQHKELKQKVVALEMACAANAGILRRERDDLMEECQRMHRDPTYWVRGTFAFADDKHLFHVEIGDGKVTLMRMDGLNSWLYQQVPLDQPLFLKPEGEL